MFYALLIVSLFSVSTANWQCPQADNALDISRGAVTVPSDGTPNYAANMNCKYNITIPDGKYATIEVNANFGDNDMFNIANALGYFHQYYSLGGDIPKSYKGTFYIPASPTPSRIMLVSKADPGSLKFTVTLHDIPNLRAVGPTRIVDQQVIPLSALPGQQTTFDCQSTYAYRVAAQEMDLRFDSCFVYTGRNPATGKFLTGLYNQADGVPTKMMGETTVICFGNDLPTSYLIATPYPTNMDGLSVWAVRAGDNVAYSLEPKDSYTTVYHDTYLTIYCPFGCNQYLNFANSYATEPNGKLTIYSGSPATNLTKMEEFKGQDSYIYLPQKITGQWITHVASYGSILLRNSPTDKTWGDARNRRQGFVMSRNYGVDSPDQTLKETMTSPDGGSYSFSYYVRDVSQGGSVQITINRGSENVYKKTITTDDLYSNSKDSHFGTSMTIEHVEPNTATSKGALVSFEMVYSTASGGFLGIATLLLCMFRI